MSHKPIFDITPFTALDYTNHLSTIFWFSKCNMRCDYCYNPDIVFEDGKISIEKALEFLKSRVGLLEAVVLSGGEVTLYSDLEDLCKEIKKLGFKIKLDTNGQNPKMVKKLLDEKLLDYVALDYKAPEYKYEAITKNRHFEKFQKTLKLLIDEEFSFEVRTTVHADLLNVEDINSIVDDLVSLNYKGTYFLQAFLLTDSNIGNIKEEKNLFDKSALSNKINIVWR
ncbi:Ribonucleotide reductase of class III (anaerobic), activating protein [hydrothermal vent metagenome]|uniref:Ribonucleotide reductase of class III (Anaerobic), activating protein n=1 Tax=hydrothermal vent metagenome TaxID=652676 RepID=A0A1W1EG84_9ZZZZ